jgi:glycosyltransferase involved in cell wall biosynthesis
MPPFRLALLGAFTFPAPLGSQRFAAEQEAALRGAGAEVERFTYPAHGVTLRGFDPRKLRADRALRRALLTLHRERAFEAVLAHNAEAALVALFAREQLGIPVVYVVHALWEHELTSWMPSGLAPVARAAGRRLDRELARRADALLVLSEPAREALRPWARGSIARIPPGHTFEPEPTAEAVEAACARHGVSREGFVLYAGNLDRYQELPLLDAAAASVPELPFVVATHDARRARFERLRVIEVGSVEESRQLLRGAAVAVLPRRLHGGFPIKLLHYMAAGRAIVARQSVADTLVDGESAHLLPGDASAADFAGAIRTLAADPALRARLGAGARATLASRHAWPERAAETLSLVRASVEVAFGR